MTDIMHGAALFPAVEGISEAKRRLYTAAVALFADVGYHAVSVKDLMQSLGQQPGALYGHVESKQQLLFELIKIGTDFHGSRIRRAVLDAGSDPEAQVRAIIDAHVRVHLEHRELARLSIRELRSLPEAQQLEVLAVRQESARTFEDVVDRGLRSGAFRVTAKPLVLNAVAGMGIHTIEWWTPEYPYDIDEVAAGFADFALKLLR